MNTNENNSGTLKFSKPTPNFPKGGEEIKDGEFVSSVKEETKHTPGPWSFNEPSGSIDSLDSNGHTEKILFDVRKSNWRSISEDEHKANARLIASAPDLLKENQGLKESIEFWKKAYNGEEAQSAQLREGLVNSIKENQELKAERDYWFYQAKNNTVNTELLEALEKAQRAIQQAATESCREEIQRYLSGGYTEMIQAACFKDSLGIDSAINKAKS